MTRDAHVEFFFSAVYVIFALAVLLLGWIIFEVTASAEYWFPFLALSVLVMIAVFYLLWPKELAGLRWLSVGPIIISVISLAWF
jgi:CBS domain containing-hemolysin-like protein